MELVPTKQLGSNKRVHPPEATTDSDTQEETPAPIGVTSSSSFDFLTESEEEEEEKVNVRKCPYSAVLAARNDGDKTQYFTKFTDKGYIHCDWVDVNEILQDHYGLHLIRRYTSKCAKFGLTPGEEKPPYYDQSYDIPEYIIAQRTEEGNLQYLTKWTNLDYDNATWEDAEILKDYPNLIKELKIKNTLPSLADRFPPPHPPSHEWKKLFSYKPSKGGLKLRSYQLDGLNFFINSWYHEKNAILADEMGLGKTVQASTFLEYLNDTQKLHGPFLVVGPLSTIPHWEREIHEWTNLKTLTFYGIKERRELIKEHEMFYENTNLPKFHVFITTYEYIIKEAALLATIDWRCVVIDEAHRLKNRQSKLITIMKDYKSDFKILLTGTPLQNNTEELWSLLNFLDPHAFENLNDFQEKFGDLNEADQIMELQSILRPLMLRRRKGDVEKAITPLEEIIVECPMAPHQKTYYKSIYNKNLDYLTRGAHANNAINLKNVCMELRKCCNHPYLLKGAEEQILIERKEAAQIPVDYPLPPNFEDDSLIRSAGKMILLDKLLAKLKEDGHRVLIFSQMTRMLDILQDFLIYRQYPYERIDGSVRGDLRQSAIDKFNEPDSKDFVFLLCTKAGGVGINLTTADTVIIYDSDWNPQNDIQATARCHRIGQTKDVKMYRFITAKSYEKKMFEHASLKLGLDHAVLESEKMIKNDDMEKLLRLGAYYAFEEDEKDPEKFTEEDIESVLSRSARIRHDSIIGGEGSKFSVTQFELGDEDIDVSSPDFWNKYKPEVVEEQLDGISIGERRRILRGEEVDTMSNQGGTWDENSWTKQKFTNLQTYLLRFGWGRWNVILENLKVPIDASELKCICRIILTWMIAASEEKYPVMEAIHQGSINPNLAKFEKHFIKQYRRDFEPLISNGASWKLSRLDLLHFLNLAVTTCPNPPDELVIPEVNCAKPAEWWTLQDDRLLVYGAWKDGFQMYTDIPFTKKEDEEMAPTKGITHRLKSIIIGLKSLYIKYKERKGQEMPFNHEVLTEAKNTWNSRDHRQIVHVLVNFGFPDTERFMEVSKFVNKTSEQVEEYVKQLIKITEDMVASRSPQEQTEGLVEPINLNQAIKITGRVKLFANIRRYIEEEKRINSDDMKLLKDVDEHGLTELTTRPLITNRFGAEQLESKVVKKLKEITRTRDPGRKSQSYEGGLKKYMITKYEKDKDGNPKMPIKLGANLIVTNLGTVVYDRVDFNSERYLFPAGYRAEHTYTSLLDPREKVWYVSEIIDNGDQYPTFKVTMKDNPTIVYEGSAPSNPWIMLIKDVEEKKRDLGGLGNRSLTISGPEYFGLSNPLIMMLLQDLPNADKVERYIRKEFVKDQREINEKKSIPKTRSSSRNKKKVTKGKETDESDAKETGSAETDKEINRPKATSDARESSPGSSQSDNEEVPVAANVTKPAPSKPKTSIKLNFKFNKIDQTDQLVKDSLPKLVFDKKEILNQESLDITVHKGNDSIMSAIKSMIPKIE